MTDEPSAPSSYSVSVRTVDQVLSGGSVFVTFRIAASDSRTSNPVETGSTRWTLGSITQSGTTVTFVLPRAETRQYRGQIELVDPRTGEAIERTFTFTPRFSVPDPDTQDPSDQGDRPSGAGPQTREL